MTPEDSIAQIIWDPQAIVEELADSKYIGFDLETTGLSPWLDDIALMQFVGDKSGKPCLVRVRQGQVSEALHALFVPEHTFVGHNITAFDLLFLGTHGIPWDNANYYDTLTAECLISTTARRDVKKNLKASVRRRLGIKIDKEIAHGEWTNEVYTEEQLVYAVEDIMHLLPLREVQMDKAESSGQLIAMQEEMETIPSLVKMTLNGLPIKPKILNTWLDEQVVLGAESKAWLLDLFGDINLGSWQQKLKAIHALGYMQFKATNKPHLMKISKWGKGEAKEIADKLMEYSAPAQRIKMYGPKWQAMHLVNDWVHPRFWSAGTDTLRMSSSDPNAQQIPRDGRHIVGSVEGYSMVWADYAQIEIRIAANIAQCKVLIEMLKEGDVHANIAAQVFDVPQADVSYEQRRSAKAMSFLLLFGGGVKLLYEYMSMNGSDATYAEAEAMFNAFFDSFEGLARMRRRAYSMSKHQRMVQLSLPNGAKRLLLGAKKSPTVILNTMVQGTAALGIKKALRICDERGLMDNYVGAQVHDEIVACVPDAEAKQFGADLSQAMIDGMAAVCPGMYVKVDCDIGKVWGS